MEAGRELDALIAERVMGLRHPGLYDSVKGDYCDVWYNPWMENTINLRRERYGASNNKFEWVYWGGGEGVPLPDYSTDMNSAMLVVEHLLSTDHYLCFDLQWDSSSRTWFAIFIPRNTESSWCSSEAPTDSHAICLAALEAVNAKV